MRRFRSVCLFLLAPVLLGAACSAAKAPALADLSQRRFVLVSQDGVPFAAANAPDIAFGEDFRVSGRVCNRYAGQGTLENGVLTVKGMASTKMLCQDEALNRLETLFAAMLDAGAQADLSGGLLALRQGGHTLVYRAADRAR